jgi:hypothetical protein
MPEIKSICQKINGEVCVPVPLPSRIRPDCSHQRQIIAELDYARRLDLWLANDADWCFPQGERVRRRRALREIIQRLRRLLRYLSRPTGLPRRPPAFLCGPTARDLIRQRPFSTQGPPPQNDAGALCQRAPEPAAEAAISSLGQGDIPTINPGRQPRKCCGDDRALDALDAEGPT